MRIISGSHRSKLINAPKNLNIRPTTDFAKEALFNILNNHIPFEDIDVLDLFAGTGSISYEFASRGAASVIAVEQNSSLCRFIQKNAKEIPLPAIRVVEKDVFAFLFRSQQRFDMIFADPPYDNEHIKKIPDMVFDGNFLKDDALLVIEHGRETNFKGHPRMIDHRIYSRVNFSIFK